MEDLLTDVHTDLRLILGVYYCHMESYLTEIEQNILRQKGVITASEVAKRVGDLLVAEDVTSGKRRVIEQSSVIAEVAPTRQVLKG